MRYEALINKMFHLNKISDLEWNIKTHDRLARRYEKIHGEIYNVEEQARLRRELNEAVSAIETRADEKIALDFGCGAGNLTQHLSNLGCAVIASDVSQGFLDLVGSRRYPTEVKTLKLNGFDLSNMEDESVDMVATYSVLHHVPDYLGIVKEFMRVLKPGGVLYIDHEMSAEFWSESKTYREFLGEMKKKVKTDIGKYLVLENYYDWLIRRFINPRYHREGDIHVFADDHIEWDRIADVVLNAGGVICRAQSYLLFRRNYDLAVYEAYKNKTSDVHMMVAKKVAA